MRFPLGIWFLWFLLAIFFFPWNTWAGPPIPEGRGERDRKGRLMAEEEREIVENLDILELYEFLKDMDVFINYEVLERNDRPEFYRDNRR